MRRQVLSILFCSTMSGLLHVAAMVLSVWMDLSNRMVTLSFSVTVICGFMLIASVHHLNTKLSADPPMDLCSCLVVAVDVFSFSQFRAARDQMVSGLIETDTHAAFWVHVRLLEDVVLVAACWGL